MIEEDPSDDEVLACAAAADADWITSGDHHLLALGEYEGIPVVTARELLRAGGRGRPARATDSGIHGEAEVVVQDAAAYQSLLDRLERAEAIAGVREGLASRERGDGPLEEAVKAIRAKNREGRPT